MISIAVVLVVLDVQCYKRFLNRTSLPHIIITVLFLMALQVLKERQHVTMAWLYTIFWCSAALSSIMALIYARADKHKWNPLYLLVLSIIGFLRYVFIFVFMGLPFLLTLYVLEIEEGENYAPGFVFTTLTMIYFYRSTQNSRNRLQNQKKDT